MSRMLFHITTGPENPTRVALGLLVARTALGNGHSVDVFLAADGVDYLRAETRAVATGIRNAQDPIMIGNATAAFMPKRPMRITTGTNQEAMRSASVDGR